VRDDKNPAWQWCLVEVNIFLKEKKKHLQPYFYSVMQFTDPNSFSNNPFSTLPPHCNISLVRVRRDIQLPKFGIHSLFLFFRLHLKYKYLNSPMTAVTLI
jgi:hypothetical protein